MVPMNPLWDIAVARQHEIARMIDEGLSSEKDGLAILNAGYKQLNEAWNAHSQPKPIIGWARTCRVVREAHVRWARRVRRVEVLGSVEEVRAGAVSVLARLPELALCENPLP